MAKRILIKKRIHTPIVLARGDRVYRRSDDSGDLGTIVNIGPEQTEVRWDGIGQPCAEATGSLRRAHVQKKRTSE